MVPNKTLLSPSRHRQTAFVTEAVFAVPSSPPPHPSNWSLFGNELTRFVLSIRSEELVAVTCRTFSSIVLKFLHNAKYNLQWCGCNLYSTMYTVYYTVHLTLYTVHCSVQWCRTTPGQQTLHSPHLTVYIVSVQCTKTCLQNSALWMVVRYTSKSTLYTVSCCTVHIMISTMSCVGRCTEFSQCCVRPERCTAAMIALGKTAVCGLWNTLSTVLYSVVYSLLYNLPYSALYSSLYNVSYAVQ